jgi:nucleoside triphosphate diphosphatase
MLRDEQYGCSWDLKQSFQTIPAHTLEEVYEVIDCIENQDYEHLPNELGDLLFQIVLYAQMGKEAELFDFTNVIDEISEKLLRRHPHVFPDATIESFGSRKHLTPEQVETNWERIKQQERLQKKSHPTRSSALEDIPKAFPALLRANKLQKKAMSTGFDWPEIQGVLAKVKEEIAELEEAIDGTSQDHIKEELGDVLFSVVNLSRHLKIDSESALRAANEKFEKRFMLMEELIDKDAIDYSTLTLEEFESYWQKAKAILN